MVVWYLVLFYLISLLLLGLLVICLWMFWWFGFVVWFVCLFMVVLVSNFWFVVLFVVACGCFAGDCNVDSGLV